MRLKTLGPGEGSKVSPAGDAVGVVCATSPVPGATSSLPGPWRAPVWGCSWRSACRCCWPAGAGSGGKHQSPLQMQAAPLHPPPPALAPVGACLRRPSLPSLWSSPSWPPCSWLWAWHYWCGSFGKSGRQRAPTGPAVRSRWVPELHHPPTSSCRLRSGSSEPWGWPQPPPLPRTARHLLTYGSRH